MVQLEAEGKSNSTKRNVEKELQLLSRHADLDKPTEVLLFIARHDCSNSMKGCLCYAYKRYCTYYGIEAKIPFYHPDARQIKLPTREKLNMIISNASKAMATKLTVSMETGIRPVELHNLRVKDVDVEQKRLYPTTAKHGASRTLKISDSLANMISEYVVTHKLQPNDQLFEGTATKYGKNFRHIRDKLSEKLNDPTLKEIRLYDFRHYFCTRKARDQISAWTLMNMMGHKRMETTQIYFNLAELNTDSMEWDCVGADTREEAMKVISAGYQYVNTIEGTALYRKVK